MASAERNTYLDQVVAQSAQLEQDLRVKKAPMAQAPAPVGGGDTSNRARRSAAEAATTPPTAVDVRVTGFGPWKTVLVPPNAFVVHTRRGRDEPLHMGLGTSFRYNPATDSYLVVPGTMQTILLNAYCICRELQGVLVQAYVQWIVAGHRHRLPQARLRRRHRPDAAGQPPAQGAGRGGDQGQGRHHERARGAQRQAAHHRGADRPAARRRRRRRDSDTGLGLRIVTVQIKEAVVTSARLWENLQKPFRSEQGQLARLAELGAAGDHHRPGAGLPAPGPVAAPGERPRTGRSQGPQRRRRVRPGRRRAAAPGRARAGRRPRPGQPGQRDHPARAAAGDSSGTRRRPRCAGCAWSWSRRCSASPWTTSWPSARDRAEQLHAAALLELERDRVSQDIANGRSPEAVQAELIARLPEIVAKLPKPDELRTVNLSGADGGSLAGIVAELAAAVTAIRSAVSSRE